MEEYRKICFTDPRNNPDLYLVKDLRVGSVEISYSIKDI